MLELLFQGFVEWLYGLVLECWEYFASVLFDLMSLDFAYLREHIPIIDTIQQIMLGVGWALLIGNLVFQATRGMAAGLGFDAEDPKLLFTRTFAFSFLLAGFNIFCSGFFTALGNGGISALISFLRVLVFQASSVIVLPLILDIDGIWWAITVSEVMAAIISAAFLLAKRQRYHY